MGSLDTAHVLITGGGSGLGAAMARALAASGAAVSLAGRRRDALATIAASLPRAAICQADITREDDCARMVAEARAAFGPIDIVIANAGAAASAPFAKTTRAQWQAAIDVNLTGTFLTVQAALPDLLRPVDAHGAPRRIVLVASTAGLKGYAYVAPYVAAKHGVVGLARALAAEYARTPLTANAVCPGYVDTPLLEETIATIVAKTGRGAAEARAALVQSNPQGRLVTPEEVAATVVWLCSAAAASITGQAIAVAGGEL